MFHNAGAALERVCPRTSLPAVAEDCEGLEEIDQQRAGQPIEPTLLSLRYGGSDFGNIVQIEIDAGERGGERPQLAGGLVCGIRRQGATCLLERGRLGRAVQGECLICRSIAQDLRVQPAIATHHGGCLVETSDGALMLPDCV